MLAEPLAQPLFQALPLFQTLPLESPFAWKSEIYNLTKEIKFFPEGSDPTVSFTATRSSKIVGYIPLIGSIIGISRIYNGIQEYELFNNTHLHDLSKRSIKWIARGALECIPLLGGIVCMIADAVATILNSTGPRFIKFEDDTACGYCHKCNFCKC